MKGFTLIELLVVVLIIGILASVAVPQYRKAVAKARTVRMFPLLRALADAEESFYMANGYYTSDIEALDISWPDKKLSDGKGTEWKMFPEDAPFGLEAAYNYRVDMPIVGYYFKYAQGKPGAERGHKPGHFFCNGWDSTIKKEVCQSLGQPIYSWTPYLTYW